MKGMNRSNAKNSKSEAEERFLALLGITTHSELFSCDLLLATIH